MFQGGLSACQKRTILALEAVAHVGAAEATIRSDEKFGVDRLIAIVGIAKSDNLLRLVVDIGLTLEITVRQQHLMERGDSRFKLLSVQHPILGISFVARTASIPNITHGQACMLAFDTLLLSRV